MWWWWVSVSRGDQNGDFGSQGCGGGVVAVVLAFGVRGRSQSALAPRSITGAPRAPGSGGSVRRSCWRSGSEADHSLPSLPAPLPVHHVHPALAVASGGRVGVRCSRTSGTLISPSPLSLYLEMGTEVPLPQRGGGKWGWNSDGTGTGAAGAAAAAVAGQRGQRQR